MLTVMVAAGLIWATRLDTLNDTLIYLGIKPDRYMMAGRHGPDTYLPCTHHNNIANNRDGFGRPCYETLIALFLFGQRYFGCQFHLHGGVEFIFDLDDTHYFSSRQKHIDFLGKVLLDYNILHINRERIDQ